MTGIGKRVAVYCASSKQCPAEYHAAARRLGEVLADGGFTVAYGVQPIILVNTRRFFDPLQQLLASAIGERFMDERHGAGAVWQLVSEPEDVPRAIAEAPAWTSAAQGFATL